MDAGVLQKRIRIALALVIVGLLAAPPALRWWQRYDTELSYRFVEAHPAAARAVACTCGCTDLAHTSLASCFLYEGPAAARNPHAET